MHRLLLSYTKEEHREGIVCSSYLFGIYSENWIALLLGPCAHNFSNRHTTDLTQSSPQVLYTSEKHNLVVTYSAYIPVAAFLYANLLRYKFIPFLNTCRNGIDFMNTINLTMVCQRHTSSPIQLCSIRTIEAPLLYEISSNISVTSDGAPTTTYPESKIKVQYSITAVPQWGDC